MEIIYTRDAIVVGEIGLNGKRGAVEVFKDAEAYEDDESFVVFENADAARAFATRLTAEVKALEEKN